MRRIFRSRVLALFALLGSAGAVAADCAPMVSGSLGDGPLTGVLLGTSTVTAGFAGGGLGFEANYSVEWEIGTYRLSNGELVNLDCRTYQISVLPV